MDDFETMAQVLKTFGHYGFRKASMSNLADAASVSRQTLYNRFQTKEAVLTWAANGVTDLRFEQAKLVMADLDVPPVDAIAQTYRFLLGEAVGFFHGTPHGPEIFDICMAAFRGPTLSTENDYVATVAAYLVDRGQVNDPKRAKDLAYVIDLAAKGVMMKVTTVEGFDAAMHRVVTAVLENA
ncbi:MAG: TetR/AcrR family transcriptional regulator [Pseudomonadota bacterium]